MAAIDFPVSLPCPRLGSPREGFVKPFVEDSADAGPARSRARFTRTLRTFECDYRFTDAETVVFRTFVISGTSGGVAPFNWTHPVTGDVHEVRFGGESLPQIVPQPGVVNWNNVTVTLVEI